jgi:hypothetical protein
MAEEVQVIRIVIDSSKAREGANQTAEALERVNRSVATSGAALDRMERSLGGIGLMMKANLAVYAAELAGRLLEMAKSAIAAAGGLEDLAEQMGIGVRSLQALQYSAAQGGAGIETLQVGITKLGQKIGEASAGNKEAIDSFNQLGVKILDAGGKLRPTEAILENVATAITSLDDPAKRVSAAMDVFGKSGAKLLPTLSDVAGGMREVAKNASDAGAMMERETTVKLKLLSDHSEVTQLKVRALFATLGAEIAVPGLELFNTMLQLISRNLSDVGVAWKSLTGGPSIESLQGSIASTESAMAEARGRGMTADDARMQALQSRWNGLQQKLSDKMTQAYVMPPVTVTADKPGVSNPVPKGTGDDVAERIRKALQDSQREFEQAKSFSDVAGKGTAAVAELEVHFKSLKAAQDAYGKTAEANAVGVGELTQKLEGQALATLKLKNLGDYRASTAAQRDQNELLEAEVRLTNALPEARAHELAVLKATQEAKAKGLQSNQQDIDDKVVQIEKGELLKTQQQDIAKAQQLWVAPLQQALADIQSSTSAWIDTLLEGLTTGKAAVIDFGQAGIAIIRRMVSEMLSLAIIRPLLGSVVGGLASAGVVSPAMASQMGYGSYVNGGGGSVIPSGLGSLVGSASGSGMLGSFGTWLNSPIAFGGPVQGTSPAALAAPQGATGAALGGITPLGAIGAAAGVGAGIYQLATARGTGSTIGGLSSIIGAGASLIPGIGPFLGLGIGLGGNLLGSLIGNGTPPTLNSYGYGQLSYGSGGFGTSGGAWGPNASAGDLTGPLGQQGASMQAVFAALGGVKDPSRIWGVGLQSFRQDYGAGGTFANQSSFLVGPNGEKRQWGMGSTDSDIGLGAASVQATVESILGGAVGAISENLRKGIGQVNASGKATFDQLGQAITAIKAFDDALAGFGKTTTDVEKALSQIDQQMQGLYDTASKYGLATGGLDAEKAKQRLQVATDFGDSLGRELDPTTYALRDVDKWRQTMLDENRYLLDNVTGALDQVNNIEKVYAQRRQSIIEQANQQATAAMEQSLNGLNDLIKNLTLGPLSNASPFTTLAGTRGSYAATLAQARAGNASALGSLSGVASEYATAARSYYASSDNYETIRRQIIADVQGVLGNTIATSAPSNAVANAQALQTAALQAMVQALTDRMDRSTEQVAALTAQLSRR